MHLSRSALSPRASLACKLRRLWLDGSAPGQAFCNFIDERARPLRGTDPLARGEQLAGPSARHAPRRCAAATRRNFALARTSAPAGTVSAPAQRQRRSSRAAIPIPRALLPRMQVDTIRTISVPQAAACFSAVCRLSSPSARSPPSSSSPSSLSSPPLMVCRELTLRLHRLHRLHHLRRTDRARAARCSRPLVGSCVRAGQVGQCHGSLPLRCCAELTLEA